MLLNTYGIKEHVSLSTLNKEMAKYIATHLIIVHRDFKRLERLWVKEEFSMFGMRVADIFHKVYTTTPEIEE